MTPALAYKVHTYRLKASNTPTRKPGGERAAPCAAAAHGRLPASKKGSGNLASNAAAEGRTPRWSDPRSPQQPTQATQTTSVTTLLYFLIENERSMRPGADAPRQLGHHARLSLHHGKQVGDVARRDNSWVGRRAQHRALLPITKWFQVHCTLSGHVLGASSTSQLFVPTQHTCYRQQDSSKVTCVQDDKA